MSAGVEVKTLVLNGAILSRIPIQPSLKYNQSFGIYHPSEKEELLYSKIKDLLLLYTPTYMYIDKRTCFFFWNRQIFRFRMFSFIFWGGIPIGYTTDSPRIPISRNGSTLPIFKLSLWLYLPKVKTRL